MACFKAHKDKLREKFRVDPAHLVEHAESLGQCGSTRAERDRGGGPQTSGRLLRALQVNPKREMRSVHVRGPAAATKIKAVDVEEHAGTPRHARLRQDGQVFEERRPGLHDPANKPAHPYFKTLHCLTDGKLGSVNAETCKFPGCSRRRDATRSVVVSKS